MNDKIRILAEEVRCSIDGLGYGEGNIAGLVKLIVKEGINRVQKRYIGYNDRGDMEVQRCVAYLKQHLESIK